MERTVVVDDPRKLRRDIRKIFGNDFYKIITEVLLNSDDSYKRLESKKVKLKEGNIELRINREKRNVIVIDSAEGMSFKRMNEVFAKYGGDYSQFQKNTGVRGLFGQGIGDVLANSAFFGYTSHVTSFKDGEVTRCDYFFTGQKEFSVNSIKDQEQILRDTYNISENGTVVEFGLSEDVIIPSKRNIKEKIEEFYMLRYILMNPQRNVYLIDGAKRYKLDATRFEMDQLELISKNSYIKFQYNEFSIVGKLSLYKKPNNDYPSKILIIDENQVVYDDTYFGFEKSLGMDLLTGTLEFNGISEVIRHYLNASDPEELLTDTRDGFNNTRKFSKNMFDAVGKVLEKKLKKFNQERDNQPIDLTTNKTFNKIMKQLNSYYRELELSSIGGLSSGKEPPKNGLEFARNQISITKGKTYGLHIYINPEMILPNEEINIIFTDTKHLDIQTQKISYDINDISDGIVRKQVIIKGIQLTTEPIILIASTELYETKVAIKVIEEKIIYPENGLEFIPKRRNVEPNKISKLQLYFDTDYLKLPCAINIKEDINGALFSNEYNVDISETDLMTDTIGKTVINIETGQNIGEIYVDASYDSLHVRATLYVRNKVEKDDGYDGLFSKLQLKFEPDALWQAQLDPNSGILYINGSHKINVSNMGKLKEYEVKNPKFKKSQHYYLLELITTEASKKIVSEQIDKEILRVKSNVQTLDEIQKEKTKMYEMIISEEL